eukprot:COSAG02_NODE_21221_length_797_cov_1.620344_1_plen_92_part_01
MRGGIERCEEMIRDFQFPEPGMTVESEQENLVPLHDFQYRSAIIVHSAGINNHSRSTTIVLSPNGTNHYTSYDVYCTVRESSIDFPHVLEES